MYATISGSVSMIQPSYIVLENQGIGYLIVTPNSYQYQLHQNVLIHVFHYVREDINTLYGFSTFDSKALFIKLLGVSGIGPKSALSILATDHINEVIMAIEESNVKFLTKFPGIGTKSAQQIILDLKGKLVDADENHSKTPHRNDAEDALISLGYSKNEIKKILKQIDPDQPVEHIVKEALKRLLKS